MLEQLKEQVYQANLDLVKYDIVIFTWGNVSAITSDRKFVVIKPSGIPYEIMTVSDMVVSDLNGNIIEGTKKPSTDLLTHLELYKQFNTINSVVHTHSTNAVAFAQAKCEIPALGTTHADEFFGSIPCTRTLTEKEVMENYELNTGKVIIEAFSNYNYLEIPAVLVAEHGPFVWGIQSPQDTVRRAVVLEKIAEIAIKTKQIGGRFSNINDYILRKHYDRKHGQNAYYGQE